MLGQLQPCDFSIIENPKVFMMILVYMFTTKDSLYYFLVRLNKKNGVTFLQNHYNYIDAYLPIKNNELLDV
jgi:hypothetical protein